MSVRPHSGAREDTSKPARPNAKATDPPERLDLASRLALRIPEAAMVLGISERKLRQSLPRLPHVRLDGIVLVPVQELRVWLREQARAQGRRADTITAETLGRLKPR